MPCGAGKIRGHKVKASSGYNRVMLLQGNESTGNRSVEDQKSQRPDDEANRDIDNIEGKLSKHHQIKIERKEPLSDQNRRKRAEIRCDEKGKILTKTAAAAAAAVLN